MSEAPFPVVPAHVRHPRRGYLLAASAASLWAINGTVAKLLLGNGFSSVEVAEVRNGGALLGLFALLALTARHRLRVSRAELPYLAIFGICGLAGVQWLYFLSIHRLSVGIALLIEYLGPLLVALWVRFVLKQEVRRRVWVALALSVTGLTLIVGNGDGHGVTKTGLLFASISAFTYAIYLLLAEHGAGKRDPISLLAYGFSFATVFWFVLAPPWNFPFAHATGHVELLGRLAGHTAPIWVLMLWLVVLGTIVPFFLLVTALRHLPATRVGITSMLEPVGASIVAWLLLNETFGALQIVGGVIVLAAIVLSQTSR
ncbi:MAG: EamA family transporter [Actinobacteria bacterium]|uniref:Unannotated protein n=1 Tax=freshwater metagenome TaxID=449393 RepID=A0A6J6PZF6_9ZZZZ|nr:EamA family transporter [Actinomycetota bacterium]